MLYISFIENTFKLIFSERVKYLHLVFLCFVFENVSRSQIIYTDIPDTTPNASFPLDLNNDGAVDFIIQFDDINKILCHPQDQHAYAGAIVENNHLPYALNNLSAICDSVSEWYGANTPGIMAWSDTLGNWVDADERFLALRLNINDQFYFGWARLSVVTGSTSFTIHDYAFESSPNNCILTGQLPSHQEEIAPIPFTLSPNPFRLYTNLRTAFPLNNATLTLYNAIGKQIASIQHICDSTISISGENLPIGTYFLTLEQENMLLLKEKIIVME